MDIKNIYDKLIIEAIEAWSVGCLTFDDEYQEEAILCVQIGYKDGEFKGKCEWQYTSQNTETKWWYYADVISITIETYKSSYANDWCRKEINLIDSHIINKKQEIRNDYVSCYPIQFLDFDIVDNTLSGETNITAMSKYDGERGV